jgi:hypothetical protein
MLGLNMIAAARPAERRNAASVTMHRYDNRERHRRSQPFSAAGH